MMLLVAFEDSISMRALCLAACRQAEKMPVAAGVHAAQLMLLMQHDCNRHWHSMTCQAAVLSSII
jgi:hypothetical protein